MERMKSKRRARVRALELDTATMIHLQIGTCLLAGYGEGCGCGLVDRSGAFVAEAAAHLWSKHQRRILKAWTHPFPPFAAIAFDNQTMPPLSDAWDDRSRGRWLIINEELAAVRADRVSALLGHGPAAPAGDAP